MLPWVAMFSIRTYALNNMTDKTSCNRNATNSDSKIPMDVWMNNIIPFIPLNQIKFFIEGIPENKLFPSNISDIDQFFDEFLFWKKSKTKLKCSSICKRIIEHLLTYDRINDFRCVHIHGKTRDWTPLMIVSAENNDLLIDWLVQNNASLEIKDSKQYCIDFLDPNDVADL